MEIRGSLQTEFVETPSAKEAVLFSNTASFLLNRLRKDSSASYVAQKLQTGQIVDLLRECCKTPPATPLDLLWVYVLLAASSLKDDIPKFRDSLDAIDLSNIQWGDEIRRTITEDRITTSFVDIRYPELSNNNQTNTSTIVANGTVLASVRRQ